MQGLQSLDQFKDFVSSIGGLGRYEDTYIVHAAEGETVVPMEVLDQNPVLKKRLFKTMMDMGIEPGRYIVGNELNSKNPVTGQPEFFLKKIGRRLRKAAADISGYAAPIVGAMYGPAAGAAVGGLLGQYKRENPGDPTQGMAMALRGGLSGIASNIASGQGALNPFGGAQGIYKSANPLELGKSIIDRPMDFLKTPSGQGPNLDGSAGTGGKFRFKNPFSNLTGGGEQNKILKADFDKAIMIDKNYFEAYYAKGICDLKNSKFRFFLASIFFKDFLMKFLLCEILVVGLIEVYSDLTVLTCLQLARVQPFRLHLRATISLRWRYLSFSGGGVSLSVVSVVTHNPDGIVSIGYSELNLLTKA